MEEKEPVDELKRKLRVAMKEDRQLLDTAIDFKTLIAEKKLERLSPLRYRLLCKVHELPDHVQLHIIEIETGGIVGFDRACQKWVTG